MGRLSYRLTPMAGNSDADFTGLAAEILRDAVQVYRQRDIESWLARYNPIFVGGNGDMAGGRKVTGSFLAVTGSFPAVTGSFPAMTGSFPALGDGNDADPVVSLKEVLGLPRQLPAIRLPTRAQLVALARSAPLMARLEELARWLGRHGRPVTADDELPDADLADAARRLGVWPQYLPYLWDYALTTGWFELDEDPNGGQTWAIIGETAWRWADGDDSGALHVWSVVFAAVLARTLNVAAFMDPHASRKLDFQGPGVVTAVMLFLAGRTGLSGADVRELVMSGVVGNRPSSRISRAWAAWVRGQGDPARLLLGELAALRAVSPPGADDRLIELTPLAKWALREQLLLDGVKIRLLASAPERMTAADLVTFASGVSDAEFEGEAASWMAVRGPDRAARELLAFAAFSGPRPRLVAVNLVRQIGAAAHLAWRDAMQRRELRGYARIALSVLADDLPENILPLVVSPDPDDLTWVATDLLALACGEANPDPQQIAAQFSEAIPEGEESWILGLMSRSSHPDVGRVLMVLGRHHPDRRVARHARRAARLVARNRAAARGRVQARVAGR
jgi:hypothetical protein